LRLAENILLGTRPRTKASAASDDGAADCAAETGLPRRSFCFRIFPVAMMYEAGQSLKGQFILDNGRLRGTFFHRTVILLCQHDAEGAFGLVINRSTGSKVGQALTSNLPATLKELPLFLGGPVQPQALSYLHSDAFLPDANVISNLNVDHSLDSLVEVAESYSATLKLKVFAGYAGWSPGQLDDEMKRNTWLVHPASLDLVFHPSPEGLWQMILRQKGWKHRLIAEQPEDLSWN
jgi:putative transcriptional regulator